MICKHGRAFPETCEDCRFVAALERGVPDAVRAAAGVADKSRAPVNDWPTDAVVADRDVLVRRDDLRAAGDPDDVHTFTLIRLGEVIPRNLVDLPREDADLAQLSGMADAPPPGGEQPNMTPAARKRPPSSKA